MYLNYLLAVLGIPLVVAMEASNTSKSSFPTLVLRPSKCNANCLATLECPLYMFWKKERQPTL